MYGPKKRLGRTPLHFQLPNFAEWTLRFIAASERCETTDRDWRQLKRKRIA